MGKAGLAPGALACDRPEADVATAEAIRPADAIDRGVGARLRLGDGLANGADVEHTPAIGEDLTALRLGAGVKDLDPVDLRRLLEALNHRVLGVAAWIALGRHHHGERGVGKPTEVEIL